MLIMDATSDECSGKESKQYVETAVVPVIMENAMKAHATRIVIQCSVCWNVWPYKIRPTNPISVAGLSKLISRIARNRALSRNHLLCSP